MGQTRHVTVVVHHDCCDSQCQVTSVAIDVAALAAHVAVQCKIKLDSVTDSCLAKYISEMTQAELDTLPEMGVKVFLIENVPGTILYMPPGMFLARSLVGDGPAHGFKLTSFPSQMGERAIANLNFLKSRAYLTSSATPEGSADSGAAIRRFQATGGAGADETAEEAQPKGSP